MQCVLNLNESKRENRRGMEGGSKDNNTPKRSMTDSKMIKKKKKETERNVVKNKKNGAIFHFKENLLFGKDEFISIHFN